MRSGEGGVYVALLLPREGREAVSRRPPAQVTHMVVTRMLHWIIIAIVETDLSLLISLNVTFLSGESRWKSMGQMGGYYCPFWSVIGKIL